MNIDKEDKEEFIAQIRGLAFTEDDAYESKAMSLLDELLENSSNDIHSVSVSFLYDFVNEFTDIEIPKEAIKESLDKLNER